MSTCELLIVSTDESFKKRCSQLPLSIDFLDNFDNLDLDKKLSYKFVIMDGRKESDSTLSGSAQVASQLIPNSKFILVVANLLPIEEIKFIYQSGASLILNEDDFLQKQKLDFFISHYNRSEYIPVKSYDFEANTTPDFIVYHLISFNGSFLPVFFGPISSEKFKKAQAVNELYIKREDLGKFSQYLNNTPKSSSDKLLSRCRAKYLEFYEEYIQLLFTLTDNSKKYTFDEGRALLAKIQSLASDLLMILSAAPDAWLVVNNLANDKNFPTLSRIPSIAAYAGITALELNIPNPEELMLACLLSDTGLLDLPPQSEHPYRDKAKIIYLNHPIRSINLVLERRVPLPENIKQIILHTHENLNGSGFPKGEFKFEKFPIESQIIQICQLLDEKAVIQTGALRPKIEDVKKELITIISDTHLYDINLVLQIKKIWQTKNAA